MQRSSVSQLRRGAPRRRDPFADALQQLSTASEPSNPRIKQQFKRARNSGHLALSNLALRSVPPEAFELAEHLEEGEKFWEVNDLVKMDISHNEIEALGDGFRQLPSLSVLIARNNQIAELSPCFSELGNLQSIDLSSNMLTEIGDWIGGVRMLAELFVPNNQLTHVSDLIFKCDQLVTLDLSSNKLDRLPQGLCMCTKLQTINLSENLLVDLPEMPRLSATLTSLDLHANRLHSFPDSLTRMQRLKYCDLSGNRLASFPVIEGPLERLLVAENAIRVIPDDITCMTSLAELHLQGNLLNNLSDKFVYLSNLKTLDVRNNNISDIPSSVGYMKSLYRLLVEGNRIRSIRQNILTPTSNLKKYLRTRGSPPADLPEDMLETDGSSEVVSDATAVGGEFHSAVAEATSSCRLDLSSKKISEEKVDEVIASYTEALHRTTTLLLCQNNLVHVPFAVLSLPSLVDLDLSNNQLGDNTTAFHDIFSRLALRRLVLCKNNLTDHLLSTIFRADAMIPMHHTLQELDLSINRMTAVPDGLKLCAHLATLSISFCRVTSLRGLSQLQFLEALVANDNAIEDIADVVRMTSLSTLSLSNNNLSTIPAELGLLTGLRSLQLEGNPQRMVRSALLQQGTDKLLAYLRSKLPHSS